jgi:hypothetical protein
VSLHEATTLTICIPRPRDGLNRFVVSSSFITKYCLAVKITVLFMFSKRYFGVYWYKLGFRPLVNRIGYIVGTGFPFIIHLILIYYFLHLNFSLQKLYFYLILFQYYWVHFRQPYLLFLLHFWFLKMLQFFLF